jgi:hypothetical protein
MAPRIADNLLRGNHGEHLVAQVLSRSCLVRPVVGNTDIGVDLYCESVIDGEPFLHFWAQVKASEDFPNEAVDTGYGFKTAHLEYWRRQPVPVLAFLVPAVEDEIRFVHVVDITMNVIDKGVNDAETQTIRSSTNLGLPISDRIQTAAQLRGLLLHHLPMVVSAQYAEKGFVYPAPKPKDEYTQFVSLHYVDRYAARISERLRAGAAMGVLRGLDSGKTLREIPKGLIGALMAFDDDLHFETHEAIGRVKQAEGKLDEARRAYERARQIIREDPNVDANTPPWSEAVTKLNARIQSLDH